jgi:hypothetical protein
MEVVAVLVKRATLAQAMDGGSVRADLRGSLRIAAFGDRLCGIFRQNRRAVLGPQRIRGMFLISLGRWSSGVSTGSPVAVAGLVEPGG